MAQFGVTTPLVSTVLSMFMAGIGLGSVAAGHCAPSTQDRNSTRPLKLYSLCELLIGISAFLVPMQLLLGHRLLESIAGPSGLSSGRYYLISMVCVAVTLVPWCACMGATIPLGMAALRKEADRDSHRSFSFLYVSNLFGAVLGATVPLLLIEAGGFHKTLQVGMTLNFVIAVSAFILSFQPTSWAAKQQAAALPQFRRAPIAAKA